MCVPCLARQKFTSICTETRGKRKNGWSVICFHTACRDKIYCVDDETGELMFIDAEMASQTPIPYVPMSLAEHAESRCSTATHLKHDLGPGRVYVRVTEKVKSLAVLCSTVILDNIREPEYFRKISLVGKLGLPKELVKMLEDLINLRIGANMPFNGKFMVCCDDKNKRFFQHR